MLSALLTLISACVISTVDTVLSQCYQNCFILFAACVISTVYILCFQPVSSALCILFSVCVISGLSYQHCSHCFQFVLSALFTPFLANVISTVYTFFCLCYHHCSHSFQPVLSALFTSFSACVISTVHIVFSLCLRIRLLEGS